MRRTAGIEAGLARTLWREATAMLTLIENRLTSAHLKFITPFKAYHERKPTIRLLKKFDETAYDFIGLEKQPSNTKLASRTEERKICGYGECKYEYRVNLFFKKVIRSGLCWSHSIPGLALSQFVGREERRVRTECPVGPDIPDATLISKNGEHIGLTGGKGLGFRV